MTRILKYCCYGTLSVLITSSALPALAQDISDSAAQQIMDIIRVKKSLTRTQRKMSSELVLGAMRARRGQSISGAGTDNAPQPLKTDAQGLVLVDLKARSLPAVLRRINEVGGKVVYASDHDGGVRAALPILGVETVAGIPEVQWIRTAAKARTSVVATQIDPFASPTVPLSTLWNQRRALVKQQLQQSLPLLASNGYYPSLHSLFRPLHITPFIGSVTSQGYITHGANQAVRLGYDGTGIKVGVLSDSALPDQVTALIATGDLPPDVTVVPGQEGPSDGANEGTAMMEIVHDLAPGAKLFFATAFTSSSSFADNIRTLRFAYGCDIIVDDVSWTDEGVFQDGPIAQAVNDVTADGALYFSSAGNDGNLTNKNGEVWEGDFAYGGDAGLLVDAIEGVSVPAHNFGTSKTPVFYDTLATPVSQVVLRWSDPLGGSANDYDLFVLNSSGTQVISRYDTVDGFTFGASIQDGTQDPYEYTIPASGTNFPAGSRIVVVLYNGSPRALHLDTFGNGAGQLSIFTSGATVGHNAGLSTVSIAATYWNSARTGTHPFTGFANRTETFSSDGPRKIFYYPNGTPITPGNVLFGTNGGTTLQKPDLTAADGGFTKTPGFLPFFGTSAAAPHAAAIAALVKSANPALTNVQIKNIMTGTALDTMTPGVDRDAGYGITMALPAVQAALGQ